MNVIATLRRLGRVAALAALAACSDGADPDARVDHPVTLHELAAAWSGSRAEPECRDTGPRGEYLGPVPGIEYCEWPTPGTAEDRLGGERDPHLGLHSLIWERVLTDVSEIERLADSLHHTLTRVGLVYVDCPGGGRRWQREGLAVHLTPIPQRHDGRAAAMVTASSIEPPAYLCPGAPPITDDRAPRQAT